MRILVQVVKKGEVKVRGKSISKIDKGIVILVGFTNDDTKEIVDKMTSKLLAMRSYPDENGKINISLKEYQGNILSVSQFTLYASFNEGRRPAFIDALKGEKAKELYDYFNLKMKEEGFDVGEGIFGEDMEVTIVNNGPITYMLDSKELFK